MRDGGNVALKKGDPGSPVTKMCNENLVVTASWTRKEIYGSHVFTDKIASVLPETLQLP